MSTSMCAFLWMLGLLALSWSDCRAQGTIYELHDEWLHSGFGSSVASVGDLNNDGIPDLIVGVPNGCDRCYSHVREAAASGQDSLCKTVGRAELFSGRDGAMLFTLCGGSESDQFGYSVSGAGDVDGDGFCDVIIGAPRLTLSSGGYAAVFSGRDAQEIHRFFDHPGFAEQFGIAVSGAGDVDQDGFSDVMVGAPLEITAGFTLGTVRVFSRTGAVLLLAEADAFYDSLGWSLCSCGDVNHDGVPDLTMGAIGAPAGAMNGLVRVISGKDGTVLHDYYGDLPGDDLGWSVSCAGDVNGDGYDDIIAGAAVLFGVRGYARLFSGKDHTVLSTFYGLPNQGRFGTSVCGVGDLDGDGCSEFAIGAYLECDHRGTVYVYAGRSLQTLYQICGEDTFPQTGFGFSIAGVDDLDGDGIPDLIAGAPWGASTRVVALSPRPGVHTSRQRFEAR